MASTLSNWTWKQRLVLVKDASFANTRGLRSQLGYVISTIVNWGRANIAKYDSKRCRHVTRSVFASEIHAFVLGFDFEYILQLLLQEIPGRGMKLEAYVDWKTVFDVIAKDERTTERRLQIDIAKLHASYERGELWKLGWMPRNSNRADTLTKAQLARTHPSSTMMETNTIDLTPGGWAVSKAKRKSLECCKVSKYNICLQH